MSFDPLFLFDPTQWADWRNWLGEHGTRVVVIVVLLAFVQYMFRRIVSRWFLSAIARAAKARNLEPSIARRRADTLAATLNWALGIFLIFLGSGLLLSEFGLNVSALIAGVGVVGIALGLGAQTLVKDVLNGMFILLEDQYAVGDYVTVAGASGQVIEINPRRTVIRDAEGNVHSIPNSAISVAVNRTESLNRVRVGIEVPFRDAQRAALIVNAVCRDVSKDMESAILAAPRIVERTVLVDGDLRIQISGEGRPADRWEVEAELRRRLKREFDAQQVQMQFEGTEVAAGA